MRAGQGGGIYILLLRKKGIRIPLLRPAIEKRFGSRHRGKRKEGVFFFCFWRANGIVSIISAIKHLGKGFTRGEGGERGKGGFIIFGGTRACGNRLVGESEATTRPEEGEKKRRLSTEGERWGGGNSADEDNRD